MKLCPKAAIALILSLVPTLSSAQSLPVLPRPEEPAPGKAVEVNQVFYPASAWFPFLTSKVDPKTYYGSANFSGANKVEFLYGFGASTKTLRAELATLLFPNGLRVSLLAATSATDNSQTGDTPRNAIEGLRTGGDTSLQTAYPIFDKIGPNSRTYVIAAPSVDFTFDGAAKAETITQSNQWSADAAVEGYWEYKALDKAGKMFASGRVGRQWVSSEFAKAAKLKSENFAALQVAVGLEIGDAMRVSIQRFKRPETTDATVSGSLAKWRLIVQFSPKKK